MAIKVDDLLEAVNGELREFADEITEGVKEDVEKTGKECLKLVKNESPQRTGAYKKGWKLKKSKQAKNALFVVIYNKDHYQLTHLLENSHLNRDGSRTEGKPHIRPAEEAAVKALEQRVTLTVNGRGSQGGKLR